MASLARVPAFGYTAFVRVGAHQPMQNWREFSLAIADQFLISEDSHEWVKEPRVRRVWHLLLVSSFGVVGFYYLSMAFFDDLMEHSEFWTILWRLGMISGFCWLLILLGALAIAYYRYLLSTGRDLRFRNIVNFWLLWVLLFSHLYSAVYVLHPPLFSYPIAVIIPGKTMQNFGFLRGIKTSIHFALYSACTTVSLTLPGLSSASLIVTALNLVETLGSLLLLVLLVATFVTKSDSKKRKA